MARTTEEHAERYLGHLLDGRYRLSELIGRGGMGAVFRALDERLKRQVAVKVIRTGELAGEELARHRQRFFREAQLAARISHPNVVTIHDYGTYVEPGTGNELDFIVMDLLRGESLAEWLPRLSRTDLSLPYSLLMQTALGVAAGHREGVVHRDVKPRNVLVVPAGEPDRLWARVLDFGIAKPLHDDGAFGEITVGPGFVGTASYASPEQLVGRAAPGPESDVFSLGLIAYQLFTGALPFTEGDRARLSQALHVPLRPPGVFNPAIPAAIEEVIVRALALDPAERFANADAFAAGLDAAWRRAEAAGQLPGAASDTEIQPAAPVADETLAALATQAVPDTEPGIAPAPAHDLQPAQETAPAAETGPAAEAQSTGERRAVPPDTPVKRPARLAGLGRRAAVWVPAAAFFAAVIAAVANGVPSFGAIATLFPFGARAVGEIVPGQVMTGEIQAGDRVSETGTRYDLYRYRGTADGTVVASVQASGFEASIEWGRMVDGAWRLLERSGWRADPGMSVAVRDSGEYVLRVQSRFSGQTGSYRLTVSPGAPPLRVGGEFTSTLSAADTRLPDGETAEEWTYRGAPGDQVTAALDSAADARLEWGRVVGGDWMSLEAGDEDDSRLTATLADSGEYVVRVRRRQADSVHTTYGISLSAGPLEIRPGQSRSGRLSRADERDGAAYELWKYDGTRQQVTFTLEGDGARLEVGRMAGGRWQTLESGVGQFAVAMDTAYRIRVGTDRETAPGVPYVLAARAGAPRISSGQTRPGVVSGADQRSNRDGIYYECWHYQAAPGQRVTVTVSDYGDADRYYVGWGRFENGVCASYEVGYEALPGLASLTVAPEAGEYAIIVFKEGSEQDTYSLSVRTSSVWDNVVFQ